MADQTTKPTFEEFVEAAGTLRELAQNLAKHFKDEGDHYVYTGSMNLVETLRDAAHTVSDMELALMPDDPEDPEDAPHG